jgi:GMP synthase-like glutamine amidotransferase
MDGKEVHEAVKEADIVSKSSSNHEAPKDVDAAWMFLNGHRDAHADTTALKALRRKIDFRIVPIMFLCYTMQFLDKVILNVS